MIAELLRVARRARQLRQAQEANRGASSTFRRAAVVDAERALDRALVEVAPSLLDAAGPGLSMFEEIGAERARQDRKWGQQDHPDVCPGLSGRPGGASPQRHAEDVEIPTAGRARDICESAGACGRQHWSAILVEEVAEAVEAAALGDVGALRRELVQIGALCVAWGEALDRRPLTGSEAVAARKIGELGPLISQLAANALERERREVKP